MSMRSAFFAVIVASACTPGVSFAQVTVESRFAPDQPPIVNAHRANCGGQPENSLAAIECAIERGIDMAELESFLDENDAETKQNHI